MVDRSVQEPYGNLLADFHRVSKEIFRKEEIRPENTVPFHQYFPCGR